ncbi:MAG: hypothetical protein D6734_02455 [Candidatus Schekmanbacteria bacterium]|nr:MAG: hypothetical protein D6734_02455 [Candidatus Schekmanbacteria bacterium]
MADDFGYSEEIQEFAKEAVWKDGRWMAVIVKAIYEKYGREAIDVLCDAFYKFGEEEAKRYKKELGWEGREDEINVAVALRDIYPNVHKHIGAAGMEIERIKFSEKESESHVPFCYIHDAWKSVWPEGSHFMCEIISKAHDTGFMHGLNPKLEWTHHAEKLNEDGTRQEGLARGKEYCKMCLVLKED